MKIGILQADSVLDQFQPIHGNYPDMIADVLGRAAADLGYDVAFTTYDVEHGIYPAQIDDCDGYVITGSRKSVYDDEPWIQVLMDYTRELHAVRKKLVGLCFGHQLIAEALGGKTEPAEVGWCVGIHDSEIVRKRWFMDPGESDGYTLIVSHKDQVARMPDGAQLLASGQSCPHSMYSIGDHILAMQGHPEFKPEYAGELMKMRQEILGEDKFTRGMDSLDKPLMRDIVSRWIMRFMKGKPLSS